MWISTHTVVDHTILLSFASVCSFISCCEGMNQLHIDVESRPDLLKDSLPLNYCRVWCALGLLRLNSKIWLLCLWAHHDYARNSEIATCQCLLTRHRRPGIQQYSLTLDIHYIWCLTTPRWPCIIEVCACCESRSSESLISLFVVSEWHLLHADSYIEDVCVLAN